MSSGAATARSIAWLGESDMAQRVRELDWSTTALGPLAQWPPSLRSAVAICLHSRFQMAVYWGPELICIYNDAERDILGKLHPEALGRPARMLLRDSWPIVGPQLSAVLERGEASWAVDQKLRFERGNRVETGYFTYSYSPILDDDGDVGGVLLVTQETTARVLGERRTALLRQLAERTADAETVEEACEAATETLEGSVDVPIALIYMLAGDGGEARCVAMSGSARGYAAALPALGRERWQDGVVPAERYVRSSPGGAPAPPRATVVPMAAAAGILVVALNEELAYDSEYHSLLENIGGLIGRGIAAARARQAERRHAQSVQDLDAAKTVLFSNASHELRTPLALILGSLEQAREDPRLPASARGRLDVACRNAARMLKLVNALLDFSRLEAGVLTGVFRATDLGELTRSLVSMFGSAADLAGVDLTYDGSVSGESIYVDREAWEKIVANLVSNALKFTPAGRISVAIGLEAEYATLVVQDTGIGIAPENLEHVFSRFHRLSDPRARTREGSGLGLALVRELVHFHGGAVEALSERGQGTRMTVRIPRGRDHLPADEVVDDPESGGVGAAAALFVEDALGWWADSPASQQGDGWLTAVAANEPSARVLVVDDSRDMRDYLRQLLAPFYEVDTAEDGGAALAAATAAPPDVVISDVMMPGLDGLSLVSALRANAVGREVPIMLLSARADAASTLQGLRLGADDYLVKPIGARELVARVRATIQLSRLRRDVAETRGRLEERARAEQQLRAAQRRVVTAADAERRRIERNLHDGAQQRLVAIGLELSAAAELIPADARARLDRVRDELDASLEELRELAHGLYPPVLASDGLAAALAAAARRAALPTTVSVDHVGRWAPEIENAAYFCCLEALQNAAKHAGAGARATIRVDARADRLQFVVRDDGVGFGQGVAFGYGLTNLRDRLAALGGDVEISSAPAQGTTVRGWLPLA